MVYRRPSKSSRARARVSLRNRYERSWKRRENFLKDHVLEFIDELRDEHNEIVQKKEEEIKELKEAIERNKKHIGFLNEKIDNLQMKNLKNSHRYEEMMEELRSKVLDKEEEIETLNKKVSRMGKGKGRK